MMDHDEDLTDFAEFVPAEVSKVPILQINVEFLELYDRFGEEEVWVVLGKLKDLFA